MAKFYIFHGDEYVRHAYGAGPDPGYPMKIRDAWTGWPRSWGAGNMDAAVYYPGNRKFYIFHADEYVRHGFRMGPDPSYPRKICGSWSGWPPAWGPRLFFGAVLYYPENERFYIFHNDQYVRHAYGQGPDPGYPKQIREGWTGWPDSWRSVYVQAALYYPGNDKLYLFQNDEYVRHSPGRGPDPGYPKKIDEVWSGWPHEAWRDPPGEHLTRLDAALFYPED